MEAGQVLTFVLLLSLLGTWVRSPLVSLELFIDIIIPEGRPGHDQQRCYHHAPTVKLEAVNAVVSS
jgi:hypothetical protein